MIEKLNQILQGLLKNPIVDEYDSRSWHVRKYGNGEVVIRGEIEEVVNTTQMWGTTNIASTNLITKQLPLNVTDATCQITGRGSSASTWITEQYTDGASVSYKFSTYAQDLGQITVRAVVTIYGRWK